MTLSKIEIQDLLNQKYDQFNRTFFIESDPISIPHLFTKKEDIEIAGFISASIAWGQRKTIIKNATRFIELMDNDPHNFILSHTPKDLSNFSDFKHRTFNSIDAQYFITSLNYIYQKYTSLENIFALHPTNMQESISNFKNIFFEIPHPDRTQKHISDPLKNSAAKRINMYLRWMVRKDNRGVDFGIWDKIEAQHLICPLDVHSGNVARKLGILTRKQNDWKAAEELTNELRKYDHLDPIKYDFSLFGLGVFEKF